MNIDEQEPRASEAEEGIEEEAETESQETQEEVDYKKELEFVQKELEKKSKRINQAEHVIETLKSKGSDINADTIAELVDQAVGERMKEFQETVRGDAIENLVESYASNPDEAELIRHHLKHSIRPSGDDITDILNAKALANKARFDRQRAEIKRAQGETEAEKVTSSGQKGANKPPKRLSADDRKIMRVYGISEEELQKGVR